MKNLIGISILVFAAIFCFNQAQGQEKRADNKNKKETVLKVNKNESQKVITVGVGKSRQAAVRDAMVRAVEKVRGVDVFSESQQFHFEGAAADFDSSKTDDIEIKFGAVDVKSSGTVEGFDLGGLIKSYEVLEDTKQEGESYKVKISVEVYGTYADENRQKVRIALAPARCSNKEYNFLGSKIRGDRFCEIFTRMLATELVKTDEFEILDRRNISSIDNEENLLTVFDAPMRERARFAESLGADYILITDITQAKIEKQLVKLKAADYDYNRLEGRFAASYRLVDCSTKEIAIASDFSDYIENDDVRQFADESDEDQWDHRQIRRNYLQYLAKQLIADILSEYDPVKVAKVDSEEVIINAGKGRISEKSIIEIYNNGEMVYDPDTGEQLGTTEELVAIARVKKVMNDISIAEVVDRHADIKPGMVCKIKQIERQKHKGLKPDVERKPSGGVKLPFD